MKTGAIVGTTVTVPDLEAALVGYRNQLGLRLVEQGVVGEVLAASWGRSANAASRMAVLQPESEAHCFIRLIEQPVPVEFIPTTTFGWAAFEFTVQDIFAWGSRLQDSIFRIVGPPKAIEGLPYFVAMQVHGPGGEMLYLNESRSNTPTSDLPKARSSFDHAFIAILAAPDRQAAVAWYRDIIGLEVGASYVIEYTMINNAFGLPPGTTSALTMIQNGRMPILEIDDYPAAASARPVANGFLPPGNAMLSVAVKNLDERKCDWLAPPAFHDGALYGGKRSATAIGPAGELVEFVELV